MSRSYQRSRPEPEPEPADVTLGVPALQLQQTTMWQIMSHATGLHARTGNVALSPFSSSSSWNVLLAASTQLMAADGLAVSIRTALPLHLVRRALLRLVRWCGRRWIHVSTSDDRATLTTSSSLLENNGVNDASFSSSRHRRKRRLRPRPVTTMSAKATIHRPPRGLRNHGQTCFLNSVLQALASSDPFLRYLEDVVDRSWRLHELCYRLGEGASDSDDNDYDDNDEQSVSELVLDILLYVNGADQHPDQCQMQRMASLKVKELLRRVGLAHAQFRPRSGGGLAHVGTEQQDAQELLQALVGMIEAESAVISGGATSSGTLAASYDDNGDESSTMISVVSACQSKIGESRGECNHRSDRVENDTSKSQMPDGDDILTLSDWLRQADVCLAPKTACEPQTAVVGVSDASSPLSQKEEKKSEDDEILSIGLQDATSLLVEKTLQRSENAKEDVVIKKAGVLPLSGWTGSVLQCLRCNHVRPLTNTPFLEIPIIPAAIGVPGMNPASPLPACSLYDCLRDFSKSERVQDVECQSCSVGVELSSLEDEIMLLKGAIDSVARRSGKVKSAAEGLVRELHGLEMRRLFLQSADLDQDDNIRKCQDQGFLGIETEGSNSLLPPPTRGPAKKCIIISRPPDVLCFHIQRRYYDAATDRMVKSAQIVAFSQIIDIAPFCAYSSKGSSMTYRLMSIIEHRGSAHGGHYVTYRRNRSGDASSWFVVSDDNVTAISWEEVRRSQAYMLIYEAVP